MYVLSSMPNIAAAEDGASLISISANSKSRARSRPAVIVLNTLHLRILSRYSGRVMNGARMFRIYKKRAEAATCPVCRTVNLLGLMCAAAINTGFLVSVGQDYNWPELRETAPRLHPDTSYPGRNR